MSSIRNFQDRTDTKLRYACLHLDELRAYSLKGSGDDFERSHQESFLYHLLGALDSFFQELNRYYGCGLEIDKVTEIKLEVAFKQLGVVCPEFEEVKLLGQDNTSWLHHAKEIRNHATHRQSIPLKFYIGGPEDGQICLKDPKSGSTLLPDYLVLFQLWWNEMSDLLKRLRESAVKQNEMTT